MKRLSQYDLLIPPGEGVPACCEPNLPLIRVVVIYLKEHEPRIVLANHEWVGDKKRAHVCNMIAGQDRV